MANSSSEHLEFAPASEDQNYGIDLWSMGIRYRWLLVLGAACGLALGVLAYLRYGPMYEATTKFIVRQPTTVAVRDVGQVVREGRGEHVAIIMSEAIVKKAVKRDQLDELPSLRVLDDPTDSIVSKTEVKRTAGRDTSFVNIFELMYMNRREEDARKVTAAIVNAYDEYLKETATEQGSEALERAEQNRDQLQTRLNKLMEKILAFREGAPLQWKVPPGVNRLPSENLDIYQKRLDKIEDDRELKMSEQARIRGHLEAIENIIRTTLDPRQRDMLARQLMQNVGSPSVASASPELLTGGRAVELDQQLLPLIVRERVLSQTYGPGMAELQAVRASIQSILAFYAERGIRVPTEAEGYVAQRPTGRQVNYASVMKTALEQQLVAIDTNLQHLDDQYDQARINARDFQKFHQKDEELNAELLRLSDLLKTAENSVTELSVKGDETYRLEQISPVRSELSTKRIIKFFGAGTIFGVLCALALAYFREFRDTSLKSVEDVRARINYPVLGGVPLSTASASGSHAADEHRGLDPDLVYLHQPGSAAAEAYRAVRTALFSAAATTGKRKFMVTSAEPGDGKSTFIANLAVAVAQAGKSVLLIDADMRKPRQQGLFSLRHQVGTADVLGGEVEVENAVQASSVDGLTILAAGGAPYNPAELLSSPRLSDVLNRVGQDYDFVLVDTPPLLTVSDPCIVAPHLDSALMVVRLGKNKSAAINRANELIATHGIDILGTVANGIPMPEVDDYYTARPAPPSRAPQPVERDYVTN